ncbi:hypothetical protein L211DRAFT_869976 [Terfezia boudieri ATCC MYA-4762]|uniref:Uncharacterized protein n=1 Tax=Terfezia boudieri ATCC MYA-4762 TaxID=1051890 RepID=A0A3N4LF14_9PEZI|nr:hypothetical protein L211DRAFT_869976 [Terfezia boudieri ATCC MYA-4762]
MDLLIPSKFIFTLLYFPTYISGSIAAPISPFSETPEDVQIETTRWQPEPAIRGTFRLLISCVVTLSLCAWTALHLNIPPSDLSSFQWYLKKAKWLLMGILAPELVAFTAWDQWREAKELTARVNEIFQNRAAANDPDFIPRKHPWTLIHSHYACMGGFVFDTKPHKPHEVEYIPNSPRLTINSHGILFLAQNVNLPDIPLESIQDHSKADDLAKILVIMQASWIIIDCISRTISQLPLTLLEVNTVAHVLCAFAIYALWWDKPLNVFVPTVLVEEWARPISAFMYMASGVSINYEIVSVKTEYVPLPAHNGRWLEVRRVCEFSDLIWPLPDKGSASALSQDSLQLPVPDPQAQTPLQPPGPQVPGFSPADSITTIGASNTPVESNPQNGYPHKPPDQTISATGITLEMYEPLPNTSLAGNPNSAHYWSKTPTLTLDSTATTRWQLSSQAITIYLKYPEVVFSYTNRVPEIRPELRIHHDLLETHAMNWGRSDGWIASTGVAVASAIYAGVHLAAWNTYFPTPYESKIWHDSALIIVICSINVAIAAPMDTLAEWVRHKQPPWHFWMQEHCSESKYTFPKVIWVIYRILGLIFKWTIMGPIGLIYHFLWYSATVQPFYDAADLVSFFPKPKNLIRLVLTLALVTTHCAARAFIVVEAFISLRKLPVKAYETSKWSQMLPHI